MNTRTTKSFDVWFMDIEKRDFHIETIERFSLKAAREYGKQRERKCDYLKFRDVEPTRKGDSK
jgi:hypothetical protein